ncbi:hypothetical protein GGR51DRAFT_543860 [Nemania sp. FL0031]|nr:hypothetical protein GGR51DRAFT_543860 [Nemania sp. FL0031]
MAWPQIRKRARASDGAPDGDQPATKRIKSKDHRHRASNYPPEFWDNLSKVSLSRLALRELDRRNGIRLATNPKIEEDVYSEDLARFARHGGPDLRHLRGFAELQPNTMPSKRSPTASQSSGNTPDTDETRADSREKRLSPSASGPEFERHLYDHRIYVPENEFLDNLETPEPSNLDEIRRSLSATRASLSPSRIPSSEFRDFKRKVFEAKLEADIVMNIVPDLCGNAAIPSRVNTLFTELEPITDEKATRPKPDFFDGVRLQDIDKTIQRDEHMCKMIIPTKYPTYPVAPNMFLELKGWKGCPSTVMVQACYVGAYGARAMHALQNYGKEEPIYDNKAYTFSATYHGPNAMLCLYAHHLMAPTTPGERPTYHMTCVGTYVMRWDRETYAAGTTAFRNARELAMRCRKNFVEAANAFAKQDNAPTCQDHTLETAETSPDDGPDLSSVVNSAGYISQHTNDQLQDGVHRGSIQEKPMHSQHVSAGEDSDNPSRASLVGDLGDLLTASMSSSSANRTSPVRSKRLRSPPPGSNGANSAKTRKRPGVFRRAST